MRTAYALCHGAWLFRSQVLPVEGNSVLYFPPSSVIIMPSLAFLQSWDLEAFPPESEISIPPFFCSP